MHSRDKIEQHLIQQKARSVDDGNNACMYRGEGGLMCAAGCLIPDELYSPALERRAISLLAADGLMSLFPDDITEKELKWWQNYHDGSVWLMGWPSDFFFSYGEWIKGNEAHHPSLLKAQLEAHLEAEVVAV